MDSAILKQVVIEQQQIKLPDNCIRRSIYQKVFALQDSPQVVVISGIRRCGKSTLLQMIRHSAAENAYYINFDDDRLVQFQLEDFQKLLELFIELYGVQNTFYFDEIQNIDGWERFIRRLHDQNNKIYITGSNATMFSKELGTRLTGRYIKIEVYPFSFAEYVSYKKPELLAVEHFTTNQKGHLRNLFSQFMMVGGIPEYLLYQQQDYLKSLYESILYRDIIARYRINEKIIKELVLYIASNVGKEITYNSVSKLLGVSSSSTISDYCSYLVDSFLCFLINRYDYSLKKQIFSAKKVYFIDQALAKTVGFRVSEDYGRLLENIVLLELKRRDCEIYFHKAKKECDFLVKEGVQIKQAIQVSLHLNSVQIKNREISGLLEAMETYGLEEGYIITESESGKEIIEFNGSKYLINIVPIWQWLLQNEKKYS